jgi:uncharacterized repeat protein (TIGR02543 family)
VTATYNAGITVTGTMPIRTQYEFTGYWDAQTGGTKYVNANGTATSEIWQTDGGGTLYAQWIRLVYTVTYNTRGGSGSVAEQTCDEGIACVLDTEYDGTLNGFSPVDGWALSVADAEGNPPAVLTEIPASHSSGDITVYKPWSYAITYDTNGGDGDVIPNPQTCHKGATCMFDAAYDGTLSGYTKVYGWGTSLENAETGMTVAGFGSNHSTGSATVYKSWIGTVSYDANGGTGLPPTSHICYKGGGYNTALQSTRAFNKLYATYNNWVDASASGGTTNAFGGYESCAGDITWYADWVCDAGYAGPRNSACGACGPGTFAAGGAATSCADCAVGSYSADSENWECAACGPGLTTSSAGTVSFDGCGACANDSFGVNSWTSVQWLPVNGVENLCDISLCSLGYGTGIAGAPTSLNTCPLITYGIEYEPNGDDVTLVNPMPATYDVATTTPEFGNPTRAGYIFGGWCDDENTTINCSTSKKIVAGTLLGDKTFWAKWTAVTFTVTYSGGIGGTGVEIAGQNPITCAYDQDCMVPAKAATLKRPGYKWTGWCRDGSSSGTCKDPGDNLRNITATQGDNINMWAMWDICPTGTASNADSTACPACLPGTYTSEAGLDQCSQCEAGNRCPGGGTQMPCSDPGEWQDETGQEFCKEVDDGYVKQGGNKAVTTCGVGRYCKNGVINHCSDLTPPPPPDGPGDAPTTMDFDGTVTDKASEANQCVRTSIKCFTLDYGNPGSKKCYYHGFPPTGYYCLPLDHADIEDFGETCYETGCQPDYYKPETGPCAYYIQLCTNPDVGLVDSLPPWPGATLAGNAVFKGVSWQNGVWDKSDCKMLGVQHDREHGTGFMNCAYTAHPTPGSGSVSFDNCTITSMTTCDEGYYLPFENAPYCSPVQNGYYSPGRAATATDEETLEQIPCIGRIGRTRTKAPHGSQANCYNMEEPYVNTECFSDCESCDACESCAACGCSGTMTCNWNGVTGAYDDCEKATATVLECAAGYWHESDPLGTKVGYGAYSPIYGTLRKVCPTGGTTDKDVAESETECYKVCDTAPDYILGAVSVTVHNAGGPLRNGRSYYSGNSYPLCQYSVECPSGQTASQPGTNPTCGMTTVWIEFNKNPNPDAPLDDATGNMPNKECTYNAPCPAHPNAYRRPGYMFNGWCTEPGGTGLLDCLTDGGEFVANGGYLGNLNAIKTMATGSTLTVYAQWMPCNNGRYSGSDKSMSSSSIVECEICQAGEYTPVGGAHRNLKENVPPSQFSCLPCDPGYYQPNSESSSCISCPAGEYCPGYGTRQPTICPQGSYCPAETPAGASAPTPCAAGTYQPATGQTSCKVCEKGNYCPTGAYEMTACPKGSYCLAEWGNHKPCPGNRHDCAVNNNSEYRCSTGFKPLLDDNTQEWIDCVYISGGACKVGNYGHGEYGTDGFCKLESCDPGYHLDVPFPDSRKCEPDAKECWTPTGRGYDIWTAGSYTGFCMEVECNVGYGLDGVTCEKCDDILGESHALAYRKSATGECIVGACESGYHEENNSCVSNIDDTCVVTDGIGVREWERKPNGTFGWSDCKVTTCADGHAEMENGVNKCKPNWRVCGVCENSPICSADGANVIGRGIEKWIGNEVSGRWEGKCEVDPDECALITTGDPPVPVPVPCGCDSALGYTSDKTLTNDWLSPCGRCANYYGLNGEKAVSTWSGLTTDLNKCIINTCMYQGQKYALSDNQCALICREGYDDGTGRIDGFNEDTHLCERTCIQGYTWEW